MSLDYRHLMVVIASAANGTSWKLCATMITTAGFAMEVSVGKTAFCRHRSSRSRTIMKRSSLDLMASAHGKTNASDRISLMCCYIVFVLL